MTQAPSDCCGVTLDPGAEEVIRASMMPIDAGIDAFVDHAP